MKAAVRFLEDQRGRFPWHKLTGPNFELGEWQDAISTVRSGDYYRVLFRPEAEITERKGSKTAIEKELAEREKENTQQTESVAK